MRTLGYFATRSVRLFGGSARRCVAMTVQPSCAYRRANSRPMPEFAPVIITVSALAIIGAHTPIKATQVAIRRKPGPPALNVAPRNSDPGVPQAYPAVRGGSPALGPA